MLIIVDSLDVFSAPIINDEGEEVYDMPELFSINMVTGITAGTHAIIPGAYMAESFNLSYGFGTFTVTQATLTVTSEDKQMTSGGSHPIYTSLIEGFKYDEHADTVVESITYKLKDAQGVLHNATGPIAVGVYDIIPEVHLIETELQPGLPVNYTVQYTYPAGKLTVACPATPVIKSFETAVGSGSSNPPVINKPAGTIPGNLLIVGLMFEKGTGAQASAPAGWTLILRTNKSNNVGMATYYKIATASEPSSYTFALTSSPKWSIGISRIEGADPTNPIDTFDGASGGQSLNATAPTVTTHFCNTLVLAYFSNKKDASWTPPAGTTELYDRPNIQQGLTSNMLAYYPRPSAGATGAKTAIASISDYWVAQQIAIRPGSGAAGGGGRVDNSIAGNAMSEETLVSTSQQEGIEVYPNPVRDQVNVRIEELRKNRHRTT